MIVPVYNGYTQNEQLFITSKQHLIDANPKIILMKHQNNYIENSNIMSKKF